MQFYITFLDAETSLILSQIVGSKTLFSHFYPLDREKTHKYVLVPLGIEYLRLLIFIVIIAAFVQLLEMIVERFSEKLYYALGIFLPLITVNCAILGIALFMLNKPYSFWQAFAFGLGGGFGWFMAIALIGGIREKINESDLPKGLGCPAITLIIIGIMSLAFVGFSGMLKI